MVQIGRINPGIVNQCLILQKHDLALLKGQQTQFPQGPEDTVGVDGCQAKVIGQLVRVYAMFGFNARLPQIVQVGGVYTPPALRGQGHARRAIGQQLAQARAAGVQRAVLFAASDRAASTYRALGFEQIGLWTLLLLTNAQVVHG